jgi:DNA-binding transcriptional MerR regulator
MEAEWTLDELVVRVSAALGAADYPGAPNGRVREVPDRRAVRWYTTIGLLDRPSGMRGRTALYGPRHLAQIVAIKRRQAQGRSLAEIQAELVGVADPVLHEIAGIDLEVPSARKPEAQPKPRGAFWAQRVTAPAPEAVRSTDETVREGTEGVLTGVTLPGGAVLLLPTTPDHDDLAALRAAAAPLIDLLAARGLLNTNQPGPDDPRSSG